MDFIIRPPRTEDAEGINALRRMPGVFENTLGIPSARLDQTQSFLAGLGANDHHFVAVLEDGTVLGVAGLQVHANPRTRHVGSIGILSIRTIKIRVWAPPCSGSF